jgi:hypothetical protein
VPSLLLLWCDGCVVRPLSLLGVAVCAALFCCGVAVWCGPFLCCGVTVGAAPFSAVRWLVVAASSLL